MDSNPDHTPKTPPTSDSGTAKRPGKRPDKDWRARRTLDDIFGVEIPEVTTDECEEGHKGMSSDWYEVNRPPHHH